MGLSGVSGFLGERGWLMCVRCRGVEGMNIARMAVEMWVPSISYVNASEQYLKHVDELLIGE